MLIKMAACFKILLCTKKTLSTVAAVERMMPTSPMHCKILTTNSQPCSEKKIKDQYCTLCNVVALESNMPTNPMYSVNC